MLNWNDIKAQLEAKSLAQIEALEREDYQTYLDSATAGMSHEDRARAYAMFGNLLRTVYESKCERVQSA